MPENKVLAKHLGAVAALKGKKVMPFVADLRPIVAKEGLGALDIQGHLDECALLKESHAFLVSTLDVRLGDCTGHDTTSHYYIAAP